MSFMRGFFIAFLAAAIAAAAWFFHRRPSPAPGAEMQLKAAQRLYEAGDIAGALGAYSAFIAGHPKNGLAFMFRGQALLKTGEYDAAISDMSRAIALGYPDTEAHIWRGAIYGRFLGDWARQAEDASAALAKDPLSVDARYIRAQALAHMQSYAEAEKEMKIVVGMKPDDPFMRTELGRLRLAGGDASAARADARLALKLHPKYSDALVLLGDADMSAGLPLAAEKNYSAALKILPAPAETRGLRARARLMRGDTAGAARDFLKSLELSGPAGAQDALNTARTLYRAGQFAAALKFADAAAADSHADAAAFELRARIRHELGDNAGALDDLRVFANADPSGGEKSAKAALLIRKTQKSK
ncbi:MAG: tetratricopeptide repeat protein [Elusimicrobiales bacterium]